MSIVNSIINVILHLTPETLSGFMNQYGTAAYIVIFLIIFCETGLVFTPFLPGDSLVFAVGTLAAMEVMGSWFVFALMLAAILGNMLNYQIGKLLSRAVLQKQKLPFIKAEYIEQTNEFFKKYGAVTIILTRFMPIIRTFAPFVAGVGYMPYRKFFIYNFLGGVIWAGFFFILGFFFGLIPTVSEHFSLVVIAIVAISLIPAVIVFFKNLLKKRNSVKTTEE